MAVDYPSGGIAPAEPRGLAPKDPTAEVDYMWDFSDWLAGEDGTGTDTILTHAITVPADWTLLASSHDPTSATGWFGGGTVGETGTFVCDIETIQGRKDRRTALIECRDR